MKINAGIAPMLRRWYVIIVGLVMTAGLAYVAANRTIPEYQAQATVVLVPGRASVTNGDNAFLFMGGLSQARDTLVESLNAPETVAKVLASQTGGTYSIRADLNSTGPLINIVVTGRNEATAAATRSEVLKVVTQQLRELQDQVQTPPNAYITAMTLTSAAPPQAQTQARTRTVIMVVLFGVGGTVLATGLVDALLRGRASSRAARRTARKGAPAATDSSAHKGAPSGREAVRARRPAVLEGVSHASALFEGALAPSTSDAEEVTAEASTMRTPTPLGR